MSMFSIRQWQYVYSRLSITPYKLLSKLNLSTTEHLGYRIAKLDSVCRRRLRLTLADLIVESESVWSVYELAQITGISRTLIHHRINRFNATKVTTFPTVFVLQQDLWSVMRLPHLAALLKSNPLFHHRYTQRISITTLSNQLHISDTDLIKLEYGAMYPDYALCTRLATLNSRLPLELRIWHDCYQRAKI